MSLSYEIQPVETVAVATEGPPGARAFFIEAAGGGERVTLGCEKFQVQGLVTRIHEALEARSESLPALEENVRPFPTPTGPLLAAWDAAELGLGFHESKSMFVIVAREMTEDPEPAVARFWTTPAQARAFTVQAQEVLAGGRQICTHCGLPIDPAGHPCPARNGSRPII